MAKKKPTTKKKTAVKKAAVKKAPAPKKAAAPKPEAKTEPKPVAVNKAILYSGTPQILSVVCRGGRAAIVDASAGNKSSVNVDASNGIKVTIESC